MSNISKKVDYYMALPYQTYFREDECGGELCFTGHNPELPGCMAQGATWQEANENLEQARREYIELKLQLGREVPVPAETLIPHLYNVASPQLPKREREVNQIPDYVIA